MQTQVLQLPFLPPTFNSITKLSTFPISLNLCSPNKHIFVCRSKKIKEDIEVLAGLPKQFHDEEWQAQQREKTKELERLRKEEDEEEERIVDEYREIGMLLRNYPQEDVFKAKKLVSSFIKSAEEVEEKIEEAAEKGELNELVLMVIWTRLDLARRDEEKDAIRSLDLLYRRVETEILKRQASPAMRLLNDLLIMHDGFDDEGWLKACKKRMIETFPREDPFSLLVPAGFDLDKHHGPLARPAMEADDLLLRIDFIREVDTLLKEVQIPETDDSKIEAFDPQSVATRLKEQEKKKDSKGKDVDLSIYKGKVLLVVNVASKCGLTNLNYPQLTKLYEKHRAKGLEILAFPCNQFLYQEPKTSEKVEEFACERFNAEYPMFQKVRVNGPKAAPVYNFLKAKKGGFCGSRIKWNFTKFLVDKEGRVIGRYGPTTSPLSIEGDIEKALNAQ